jgi:hypothetical protein
MYLCHFPPLLVPLPPLILQPLLPLLLALLGLPLRPLPLGLPHPLPLRPLLLLVERALLLL